MNCVLAAPKLTPKSKSVHDAHAARQFVRPESDGLYRTETSKSSHASNLGAARVNSTTTAHTFCFGKTSQDTTVPRAHRLGSYHLIRDLLLLVCTEYYNMRRSRAELPATPDMTTQGRALCRTHLVQVVYLIQNQHRTCSGRRATTRNR